MDLPSALKRFASSPLGLLSWALPIAVAALCWVTGVSNLLVALPAGILVSVLLFLSLAVSPLGGKAIVAEGERERSERDARILGGIATARKRLSLVRPPDASVAAALDRLVLAAGRYLESAVRTGNRDPLCEDAVLGAVEVMDDYLRLADSSVDAQDRGGEGRSPGVMASGARRRVRPDTSSHAERTCRALDASREGIEVRLGLAPGKGGQGRSADGLSLDEVEDRVSAREELGDERFS